MVCPTGKNEPESGTEETDPQVPEDTASVKVTCAPRCPFSVVSALALMLSGQVRSQVDPVLAAVTVYVAVEVLLLLSGSVVPLETVADVS